MFRAVVVSNETTDDAVKLQVRYFRKSIFHGKRKVFSVEVKNGTDTNKWKKERYLQAKTLKPGDELYVDPYGEGWCDPVYHNKILRKWNLKFA